MKPLHAIIGMGEVGTAHSKVLGRVYDIWEKDVEDKEAPGREVEVMHVALNYHALGHAKFVDIVAKYLQLLRPRYLDILSTVAPGTTELFGPFAVHSTTRGLHPNLESGLATIAKHVGGPASGVVAKHFEKAGVRCHTHRAARTSELAHILNNSAYGVSLMFADEMAKLCRQYGVDYVEAVMIYTATHNDGFSALDHGRLVRPILTPPSGRIGGHCVTQGASLIPQEIRGPMLERLACYNDEQESAARQRWLAGLRTGGKDGEGLDAGAHAGQAGGGSDMPLVRAQGGGDVPSASADGPGRDGSSDVQPRNTALPAQAGGNEDTDGSLAGLATGGILNAKV